MRRVLCLVIVLCGCGAASTPAATPPSAAPALTVDVAATPQPAESDVEIARLPAAPPTTTTTPSLHEHEHEAHEAPFDLPTKPDDRRDDPVSVARSWMFAWGNHTEEAPSLADRVEPWTAPSLLHELRTQPPPLPEPDHETIAFLDVLDAVVVESAGGRALVEVLVDRGVIVDGVASGPDITRFDVHLIHDVDADKPTWRVVDVQWQ